MKHDVKDMADPVVGASAKAIAAHLGGMGECDGWYPSDSGDFLRCEALLDSVPEYRARLPEMAAVNAYWHALVEQWGRLRALDPDERSARMREIIDPIEKLDPQAARMSPIATLRVGGAVSFSHEDYLAAKSGKRSKPRMKPDPEFDKMAADAYGVTADELRAFIERYELLESERKEIADQQKEVMAEARGRGYDTKVLRKIIALRKRQPDDVAEEQAVLDLYKAALGMD